jgi:hypothetical protein
VTTGTSNNKQMVIGLLDVFCPDSSSPRKFSSLKLEGMRSSILVYATVRARDTLNENFTPYSFCEKRSSARAWIGRKSGQRSA